MVKSHFTAHENYSVSGVVGRVIQPWQEKKIESRFFDKLELFKDLNFVFSGNEAANVANCIAANFSLNKSMALSCGGFDENFVGAAYRFETEFAKRMIEQSGMPIRFEPSAKVDHLHSPSGGTRSYGNHLTTTKPHHSVGDYYYAYCRSQGFQRFFYITHRLMFSAMTKFHLLRPWWIPAKIVGELRGLLLARKLFISRSGY